MASWQTTRTPYFNPRSSCEERPHISHEKLAKFTFQSTLLMRGATAYSISISHISHISIHAPHARSDATARRLVVLQHDFNPRSSCEERLGRAVLLGTPIGISIHAPHARSDIRSHSNALRLRNFNPRSSCEERRNGLRRAALSMIFQSTLLMRGAT